MFFSDFSKKVGGVLGAEPLKKSVATKETRLEKYSKRVFFKPNLIYLNDLDKH